MKKLLLTLFCAVLVFGACDTYNEKNYKTYRAISYDQYEKQQSAKPQTEHKTKLQPKEKPALEEPSVKETDLKPSVSKDADASVKPAQSGMEDLSEDDSQDDSDSDTVESVNTNYGEAAVVMSSKTISLGDKASYGDMEKFQASLDAAYEKARGTYKISGFTYNISPAGTVNPMSEMDVQCLVSEKHSKDNAGKAACDMFFDQISSQYNK
jgi:hypothetical protein